jgi:hypothetical protein
MATDHDRNNDLVAELKARLKSRNRALDEWQQAQAKVHEAKRAAGEWRDVLAREETALREVEHELLTGISSVPLIAAARVRDGAASNGVPPPSADPVPMDEHQALRRALNTLPQGHGAFSGAMTDLEILAALEDWPTQRYAPPNGPGQPWAVVGGKEPRFWWGHDAREGLWPMRGGIGGAELAALVRKEMKIGKLKPGEGCSPRPGSPAASAVEMLPDGGGGIPLTEGDSRRRPRRHVRPGAGLAPA